MFSDFKLRSSNLSLGSVQNTHNWHLSKMAYISKKIYFPTKAMTTSFQIRKNMYFPIHDLTTSVQLGKYIFQQTKNKNLYGIKNERERGAVYFKPFINANTKHCSRKMNRDII